MSVVRSRQARMWGMSHWTVGQVCGSASGRIRFRPYTAVTDVSSRRDDFGNLELAVVGRGFLDDGAVTRLAVDADGLGGFTREDPGESGVRRKFAGAVAGGAGDDVRRSGGEDRERDVAAGERHGRLADRAVPPGDGDEVGALGEALLHEQRRVAGAFRREEGELDAESARARGDRGHLRGPVAPARGRVVDEEASLHDGPSKSGPADAFGGRPRWR